MRFSNFLAVVSILGYVQARPISESRGIETLSRATSSKGPQEPPKKLPSPVKAPPPTGNAATDKANAQKAAADEASKDAGLLFDAEQANNADAKKNPKNAGVDAKANKDQQNFHASDATADEQSIAKGITADVNADQKGKKGGK